MRSRHRRAAPPSGTLIAEPVELPMVKPQMGTVKRWLTLRPIARCSANLMWSGSDGVRPQMRQG
ncbi:MAG TPA: hypothetical protein VGK01_07765 [Candidatus Angelobacter sp.]